MDQQRLTYLIDRYQARSCNDEELQELTDWYKGIDYGPMEFEQWIREAGGETELTNLVYQGFTRKLIRERRARRARRIYRSVGVAAIAIVAIVFSNNLMSPAPKSAPAPLAETRAQQPIRPGRNTATLTLSDGSVMPLDSGGPGAFAKQGNVLIRKDNQGQLIYNNPGGTAVDGEPVAWNKITTPRGGQFQVRLPDGTQVWLNAESSIRYPVLFSGEERRIEVTGEAYLEVAHDPAHPFRVISGNQEIRVLGTHFNVNSYSDELTVNTTLLQGSVQVSNSASGRTVVLKPGQQCQATASNGAMDIRSVNASQVISWKNGYFLFDRMDIVSIMKIIRRWYDVDVQFNNIDKSAVFGGTFSRNADIREILDNLEILGQVHFRVTGRQIMVTR